MSSKGVLYRLSPLAEIDLEEIWFYTFERWSVEQADRYHGDIIAMFELLASKKLMGRPVDIREGYLKFPVGSHIIYFRTDSTEIPTIIRILHQQMDVGKHL